MKKEKFTKEHAIILVIGLLGFFIYPIIIKNYDLITYIEGLIYFTSFSFIFILLSNYKEKQTTSKTEKFNLKTTNNNFTNKYINQKDSKENIELDNNSESGKISNENEAAEKYKTIFDEGKFNLFREISSQIGLIDKNTHQWIYEKEESTFLAVLHHKLKNNNFYNIKKTDTFFSKISKNFFGIEVKTSTISMYKEGKEKFEFSEHYKIFYNETLKPFGDK